jgi:hypothetical protein
MLYSFLISPKRVKCHTHVIPLDFDHPSHCKQNPQIMALLITKRVPVVCYFSCLTDLPTNSSDG